MSQTAPLRGNPLRALRASNLVVDLVELAGVARKFVQCPGCGRFVKVARNELTAHNTLDEKRCENSRRRVINDLDPTDWAAAYDQTARQVERSRRPSRVHYKPAPPPPPPSRAPSMPPLSSPPSIIPSFSPTSSQRIGISLAASFKAANWALIRMTRSIQ